MSKLHSLKVFINQRLAAAVEEVMGRLERAITEYEEEIEGRHQRLLLLTSKPEDERQRADVQQQLVIKEEVVFEEQEWIPSLDQDDTGHPHIKEEKWDFWTSEEASGQFQILHESRQTELSPESVVCSSIKQAKTEADRKDCGGREMESGFKSQVNSDYKTSCSSEAEIRSTQTVNTHLVGDTGGCNSIKPFSCSKCGKRFGQKHHLQTHMRCHTGEKPFSCSLCGKRFTQKGNLTQHLTVHTREKPCNCPVCGEKFSQRGNLTQHMTVHTREKLCW
ncbi:zinc finger protein 184-like [Echeneis naucrates]|uniref:Zinc finger protein 184-like n=1 Tax=Echeneis naucrates TaxID=173247 RepID=A0A665UYT3_ECHNA|nr:zinc finger protein 184-like [Echeneis naucrates]